MRGVPYHDAYIFGSQYQLSTKLPKLLKDGETLMLLYPPDIFKTYKFQNEKLLSNYYLDLSPKLVPLP